MKKDVVCSCHHGVSRRTVLQGGLAAAAVSSMSVVSDALLAEPAAPAALKTSGARAIDIHAHYFPQTYLDLFNTEGQRYSAEFRMTDQGFFFKTPAESNGPLPAKFIDLKQRLADMDAQGVAVHALSLTGPMVYWADGEFSHKLAGTWNDAAVAAHQANPDRFVVLATLPMLDPDRAVDELNRVSKLPGVRGVYMGTNIEGRDLDDPLFEPIFTRIEALGLPVFLHPLPPILGGKRLQPLSLTNLLAYPLDTTVAASHLIFGGVLDRHPNLLIVLPHAGGALLEYRRAARPRLECDPRGKALRPDAERVPSPLHVRHHRSFQAPDGIHHFASGRRSNHDGQRLLLSGRLRPSGRSGRGTSLEPGPAQDDTGRNSCEDSKTLIPVAFVSWWHRLQPVGFDRTRITMPIDKK